MLGWIDGARSVYDLWGIPAHTNCRRCGECCGPVLATPQEIMLLRQYLAAHAGAKQQAIRNQSMETRNGERFGTCMFLDRMTKACMVYGARPLACRLMGVVDGMECAHGNTYDEDGSRWTQYHASIKDKLRLLNTERWE